MAKKQSFVASLSRGFIRSAVNQVGRDTGKVFSNSVYKGKNYTPYMNVANMPSMMQVDKDIAEAGNEEYRQNAVEYPYTLNFKNTLLMTVLILFISPIAIPCYLIFAIMLYNRKWVEIRYLRDEFVPVPDRRRKDGYRSETITRVMKERIEADEETIKGYKKTALIMFCIMGGFVLFNVIMAILTKIL